MVAVVVVAIVSITFLRVAVITVVGELYLSEQCVVNLFMKVMVVVVVAVVVMVVVEMVVGVVVMMLAVFVVVVVVGKKRKLQLIVTLKWWL